MPLCCRLCFSWDSSGGGGTTPIKADIVGSVSSSLPDSFTHNPFSGLNMVTVNLRATTVAAVLTVLADQTTATCPSRFSWENNVLTKAAINSTNNAELFDFGPVEGTPASSKIIGGIPRPRCKTFPGDPLWPSNSVWNLLNLTLGGALIKTVPLAAPCYSDWPQYDAAQCEYVKTNWNRPQLHVEDPTSAMFPLWQGQTCMPLDHPSQIYDNCTLGGYASYSVAVTKVSQIQLALNFARATNIRLVVKNTGHDFADKSMGAGSLSIWTHKLKDIQYIPDYTCNGHSGPALKLGSGVETEEVYQAAEAHNVTVVGGECRTVGMAGGYIAGGGHSPMSSLVGMGADQVLSLDVVLPNGRFVTASQSSYPDLFWALRGGGGSTYGVVTSVTVKAYPQIPVSTLGFVFGTSPNVTADTFWAGVEAYTTYFDTFTAVGAYGYWLIVNIGPGQFFFSMNPLWGGNMTLAQFQPLIQPFLDDLANLGISIDPVWNEYPSLYQAHSGTFPPENVGGADNRAASRLFPKDNFINPTKRNETMAAVRYAVEAGGILIGYNIRAAPNSAVNQTNSVNPAWRETTGFFILAAAWPADASPAVIQAQSNILTNDWMARWRQVSPGAGSYLSEGDINEPNWQQSFYGSHYPRLLQLKKKYDPTGLFYAHTAVGSEDWEVEGQLPGLPTQNGRLCKKP
ncbi:hypothetical protein QC764_405020 [Podospora pseudoanserina]|uniref:FAD-binding PCMH-type domain-containing protein n=1 Tax=Podospora pseudoanserina TaxID=2609844 RepID=A0ABR0IAR7_9PEZI|nr:hypothetical protein QC764_405020 [Podospora pseudoanserina]